MSEQNFKRIKSIPEAYTCFQRLRDPEWRAQRGPHGKPRCPWCGQEGKGLDEKIGLFCSIECINKYHFFSLKTRARRAVRVRDGGKCALCGKTCSRKEWDIDHIVPLSQGGRHEMSNLRTLCKECHKKETGKLVTKLNRIGKAISRREALRLARAVLEQAEHGRLEAAQAEAARESHWEEQDPTTPKVEESHGDGD
jgi:hypothetical protein